MVWFRGRGPRHQGQRQGRGLVAVGGAWEDPPGPRLPPSSWSSRPPPWTPSGQGPKERELSWPWVNEYLARAVELKYQLKEDAGRSKAKLDFDRYVEQRNRVETMSRTAREAFFRKNPGEEGRWLPVLAMSTAAVTAAAAAPGTAAGGASSFECDNCEVRFRTEADLLRHEAEHQACGLDGCSFLASPDVLQGHIVEVHASGLYGRICRRDTPEEIQKWRAERKKNYPVHEKTEKMRRLQEQRVERKRRYLQHLAEKRQELEDRKRQRKLEKLAISIPSKKRKQRKPKARLSSGLQGPKEESAHVVIGEGPTDQNISNGTGSTTGQTDMLLLPEWFGSIEPFPGTARCQGLLNAAKLPPEPSSGEDLNISDDDYDTLWPPSVDYHSLLVQPIGPQPPVADKPTAVIKEAIKPPKIENSISSDGNIPTLKVPIDPLCQEGQAHPEEEVDSDEPPEEEPVQRQPSMQGSVLVLPMEPQPPIADKPKAMSKEVIKPPKIENSISSDGNRPTLKVPVYLRCPEGQPHAEEEAASDEPPEEEPVQRQLSMQASLKSEVKRPMITRPRFKVVHKGQRPPSLLERLLKKDIDKERCELLQCLRYVCDNNFFMTDPCPPADPE